MYFRDISPGCQPGECKSLLTDHPAIAEATDLHGATFAARGVVCVIHHFAEAQEIRDSVGVVFRVRLRRAVVGGVTLPRIEGRQNPSGVATLGAVDGCILSDGFAAPLGV